MKNKPPALLASALLLAGCGVSSEAEEAAQRYWDSQLTKCGDSWYSTTDTSLSQYKDLEIVVVASDLSEADKLNGDEWNGETRIETKMFREYHGEWALWMEGTPIGNVAAPMSKHNGRWYYSGREIATYENAKKISCEEVPR